MYNTIVVPLGKFDKYGEPLPDVRSRLDAALSLARSYRIRWMILSGGLRGAAEYISPTQHTDIPATEASLAFRYLRLTRTIPDYLVILQDTVSMETVGNVVIPVEAFIRRLGIDRVLCVTSCSHATRVQRLYDHLCRDVRATVFPAGHNEAKVHNDVPRGVHFVEELCEEVARKVPIRPPYSDDAAARATAFGYLKGHHGDAAEWYKGVPDLAAAVSAVAWTAKAAAIRDTHDRKEVASWLTRWREPQARGARLDAIESVLAGAEGKDHAQDSVIEMLASLGQLVVNGTVPPEEVREMMHTIPARSWFTNSLERGLSARTCAPEITRAVARVVLLSINFCQDTHGDLMVYSPRAQVRDRLVSQSELASAGEQCQRLVGE